MNIEDSFSLHRFHAHTVFQTLFSMSMLIPSVVENPMQPNTETSISFSKMRVGYWGLAKLLNICQFVNLYKLAGGGIFSRRLYRLHIFGYFKSFFYVALSILGTKVKHRAEFLLFSFTTVDFLSSNHLPFTKYSLNTSFYKSYGS